MGGMDLTPLAAIGAASGIFVARIYLLSRGLKWARAHPDLVDKAALLKAKEDLRAYRDDWKRLREEPQRHLAAAKEVLGGFHKTWSEVRDAPARHLREAKALLGPRYRRRRPAHAH